MKIPKHLCMWENSTWEPRFGFWLFWGTVPGRFQFTISSRCSACPPAFGFSHVELLFLILTKSLPNLWAQSCVGFLITWTILTQVVWTLLFPHDFWVFFLLSTTLLCSDHHPSWIHLTCSLPPPSASPRCYWEVDLKVLEVSHIFAVEEQTSHSVAQDPPPPQSGLVFPVWLWTLEGVTCCSSFFMSLLCLE